MGCAFFEVRNECLNIIMRSLHDVHEINAYRADPVRLSVRMIQLEKRWMNFD
jgi:hypothetical protein